MRVYEKGDTHLFCGHWNGSPVEVGVTPVLTRAPASEALHYHDCTGSCQIAASCAGALAFHASV